MIMMVQNYEKIRGMLIMAFLICECSVIVGVNERADKYKMRVHSYAFFTFNLLSAD